MNKVLYSLCRHNVSIMDGWRPFPSTALCETCNISLYQTRKELKKLKEKGLVDSCMEVNSDEDGTYILRGYEITEKAKHTEEYKKAYEEERKLLIEVYEQDIFGPMKGE